MTTPGTPPPTPTTFAVVGSGWRSEFFLRLARAAPERLRAVGVVTRSAASGQGITDRWSVPTVRTVEELLRGDRPDFVVASVPWAQMPVTVRELHAAGIATLAETPPAPDLDGLRSLWADVGAGGRVQVAEQYLLMPGHAARLALVRAGVIGEPTSVQLSSTHMYHAVSLIRGLLGVGTEEVVVNARSFTAPLLDPLSSAGWDPAATPQPRSTVLATLDFGGRSALYDFTDNQWWNPLRARRIVVRGTTGEIVDDAVTRMVDPTSPVTSPLSYRRRGVDVNLEGVDLDTVSFDGQVVYRNAWAGTRMSEDDVAVAQILADTGAWARGEGPAPYPLAEACQDHAIALAVGTSATTGADVRVTKEAWA
ncbi:putative dehydrogenase [Kineococcus radiotolerans]|uniref:Putative dehydrogenase n=1 Tax=Kineococcus radiotolerans TaxID=131568 RepID=A0A7W4XY02_KINRA|nr:Gfo/Idh/MocA family oxidoreductase [Kineococcus radiotolerans]MBB2901789.1 putative dehydrogenase [Kineococcus radiotolerans]